MAANDVFRDYVVDGVPSSGAHEPVKSEMRTLFTTYEGLLGGVGGAGSFTSMAVSGSATFGGTLNLNGTIGAVNAGEIWTQNNQNGFTSWQILNNSAGNNACAALTVKNNLGSVDFIIYGGSFTGSLFQNRGGLIAGSTLAGLLLTTVSSSSTIDLAIGNSKVATVNSKFIGSIIAGTAADPSLVVGGSGYGFYQPGANQLGMSVGAALAFDYGITTSTTFTFGASITGANKILSNFATGGIGYATGAGGTVTQITSRTTGVTLNKVCGAITLVSAAGSTSIQAFTVTNSAVEATDTIHVCQKSGTDRYRIYVTAVGAGSFEISYATLSGTTTEQPVFNFVVIKGKTS